MVAIRILSNQLTNQIAAGEVVERPVSVVKELVENSIDAAATQIDVDIEQGGSRLIRVRDNGSGIEKDQLSLALARHATSKITRIDDLASITSLGFRGEALASISSVSRLTLTSRTEQQSEAWQIYQKSTSGSLSLKPAAYPVGSMVEVSDLFYNVPARRRFLKTDKTEFIHIDETIKRIALVYPLVSITLQHNSKLIHQYRANTDHLGLDRRVTAVLGSLFMSKAIKFEWQHDDIKIVGWVAINAKPHCQYVYVNDRIVRDRLLSHAIKQAYSENNVHDGDSISYVIYLYVDPYQLDVNVHPTKYEVRFYHSRLVHDFVYQSVLQAFHSNTALQPVYDAKQMQLTDHGIKQKNKLVQPFLQDNRPIYDILEKERDSSSWMGDRLRAKEQIQTNSLLFPKPVTPLILNTVDNCATSFGRVVALLLDDYAILQKENELQLLSLTAAQRSLYLAKLVKKRQEPAEKLFIPLMLNLTDIEKTVWQQQHDMLSSFKFDFKLTGNRLQLLAIPSLFQALDVTRLISLLLAYLKKCIDVKEQLCQDMLADWLIDYLLQCHEGKQQKIPWSKVRVVTLLTELELFVLSDDQRGGFVQPIDLTEPLALLRAGK